MRESQILFQSISLKTKEFLKKQSNFVKNEKQNDKSEKQLRILKKVAELAKATTLKELDTIKFDSGVFRRFVNCEAFCEARTTAVLLADLGKPCLTGNSQNAVKYAIFKSGEEYKLTVRELRKDFFSFYVRKMESCNFVKTKLMELCKLEHKSCKVDKVFGFQLFILPFEFLQNKLFVANFESVLIFFKEKLFVSDFANYCSLGEELRRLFEGLKGVCVVVGGKLNGGKKPAEGSKSLGNYFSVQRQFFEKVLQM